jgi:hypothetical protein
VFEKMRLAWFFPQEAAQNLPRGGSKEEKLILPNPASDLARLIFVPDQA